MFCYFAVQTFKYQTNPIFILLAAWTYYSLRELNNYGKICASIALCYVP